MNLKKYLNSWGSEPLSLSCLEDAQIPHVPVKLGAACFQFQKHDTHLRAQKSLWKGTYGWSVYSHCIWCLKSLPMAQNTITFHTSAHSWCTSLGVTVHQIIIMLLLFFFCQRLFLADISFCFDGLACRPACCCSHFYFEVLFYFYLFIFVWGEYMLINFGLTKKLLQQLLTWLICS